MELLFAWLISATLVSQMACEGMVRLAHNESFSAIVGRVEIFFDEDWGTICDHEWDKEDASVVCRQLGFLEGYAEPISFPSHNGPGTAPVHFSRVNCAGTESNLLQCQLSTENLCAHFEDVGVLCVMPTTTQDSDTEDPLPVSTVVYNVTITETVTEKCAMSTSLPANTDKLASIIDNRCKGGNRASSIRSEDTNAAHALGAFTGVLLLTVIVITIGWICTCIVMTRRNKETLTNNSTGSSSLAGVDNRVYPERLDSVTSQEAHHYDLEPTYAVLESNSDNTSTPEQNTYEVISQQGMRNGVSNDVLVADYSQLRR